jgi:cholesterol transport system auxiliary component
MSQLGRRAVLAFAGALAGCSVLPQRPYEERREWPLDVRRPTTEPANQHGPVLLVRSLRAGPGLDERGLRTVQADGAEKVDYWEEWAVPPPQAVEDALRQWLMASGKFAAVVAPGSQLQPTLILEGELLALAADLATAQARASLSIVLLRSDGGRREPVLQQSFTGMAPLRGHDGPALADAMRRAVAVVLSDAERAI